MERFILQEGKAPSTWVVTDTINGIVVRFNEHQFNDTQKATLFDNHITDMMELARAMRELGDWLAVNYSDIVF